MQSVLSRGLNDPRIRGLISVTKVEVLPDFSEARVFISVLPQEHEELSLHGLRSATGFIQKQIAPSITSKRMPRLMFRVDESLKKMANLDSTLAQERRSA